MEVNEQNLSKGMPRAVDRALIVFELPESMHELGCKEIGLIELNADEELMATRRCRNDLTRLAYELSKESLRMIDGKMVKTGDGSADRAWNAMHPKVRGLVIQAYAEVHNAKSEEAAGFLQSRKVIVG